MRQSLNIMSICTRLLLSGSLDNSHRNLNTKIINPKRMVFKKSMEGLIHHFKLMSTGFKVNKNDFYMVTETPKGEFGVCIYSNNSTKPDRCRIRAPGFLHLQSLS
jgi:NADH-quinone oxidoreductase subunit D